MIIIFTHIKFSRIYSPGRNARKYVLRENFYAYSMHWSKTLIAKQGYTHTPYFSFAAEQGHSHKLLMSGVNSPYKPLLSPFHLMGNVITEDVMGTGAFFFS